MKFEQHIEVNGRDAAAADILKEVTELSKQAIKRAMTQGAVWLTREQTTQRIRRADKTLKIGDSLHIYYDDEVLSKQPANALLIADEGDYSIWVKPYGMLCQGSKWGDHCTINRWVEKNHTPQRPAFIVHRLDRAATGLIIIAHAKKVAAYFSKLFERREIIKRYHAIVHGEFPDAQIFDKEIEGKQAISRGKKLDYFASVNQSLIEVSIETGRKHQIRRHLSEAGFPIVGDRLYGNVDGNTGANLALMSCYLSFVSPEDMLKKTYELTGDACLSLNELIIKSE